MGREKIARGRRDRYGRKKCGRCRGVLEKLFYVCTVGRAVRDEDENEGGVTTGESISSKREGVGKPETGRLEEGVTGGDKED